LLWMYGAGLLAVIALLWVARKTNVRRSSFF
jgi:hypothetical protein